LINFSFSRSARSSGGNATSVDGNQADNSYIRQRCGVRVSLACAPRAMPTVIPAVTASRPRTAAVHTKQRSNHTGIRKRPCRKHWDQ